MIDRMADPMSGTYAGLAGQKRSLLHELLERWRSVRPEPRKRDPGPESGTDPAIIPGIRYTSFGLQVFLNVKQDTHGIHEVIFSLWHVIHHPSPLCTERMFCIIVAQNLGCAVRMLKPGVE